LFFVFLFEFTKSDEEVADHLLETHFPGCEKNSHEISQSPDSVDPATEENWLEASRIISEDKIRWAIAGFGRFKTAGEDGIIPALLKNGILLGFLIPSICSPAILFL
jgi:hypothetical protein